MTKHTKEIYLGNTTKPDGTAWAALNHVSSALNKKGYVDPMAKCSDELDALKNREISGVICSRDFYRISRKTYKAYITGREK